LKLLPGLLDPEDFDDEEPDCDDLLDELPNLEDRIEGEVDGLVLDFEDKVPGLVEGSLGELVNSDCVTRDELKLEDDLTGELEDNGFDDELPNCDDRLIIDLEDDVELVSCSLGELSG
jgi:hypothetical protein